METQLKPTVMMRVSSIKFDRVIPTHILAGINGRWEKPLSTCPVISMKVLFHQSGEAYAVRMRLNGCTLNLENYCPEVVAYLQHAADEALTIVQPLSATHA